MNTPSSTVPPSDKVGKYIIQNGSVQFDQGKDQHLTVMMGEAYVERFVVDRATNTTTCAIAITPYVAGAEPCMASRISEAFEPEGGQRNSRGARHPRL